MHEQDTVFSSLLLFFPIIFVFVQNNFDVEQIIMKTFD